MNTKAAFVIFLLFQITAIKGDDPLLACNHPVYCNNDILSVVQLSGIFEDSKTFVDMPIKTSIDEVLASFAKLSSNSTKDDINAFLNENFLPAGSDLEEWLPPDWSSTPDSLSKIYDNHLRDWASGLNNVWKELGRQVVPSVISDSKLFSLLPSKHGFIIPGGRFREFYYWDTYWIVNGLIASDMLNTVEGILENFFGFIDTLGFIPNGARIYYTERTQPPLLTQMVQSYYDALQKQNSTQALVFLETYISKLDKEHQFWMSNRSVAITKGSDSFILNRFEAHSNFPRPEGYAKDVATGTEAGLTEPESPNLLYQQLATGAESGWDFSSRWFENNQLLSSIAIVDIIPVDLNAIMYKNEVALYKFYTALANSTSDSTKQQTYSENAQQYLSFAQDRKNALEKLFWNDDLGLWLDYNVTSNSLQSNDFYPSSFVPLWANLYWDSVTEGTYSASYIEQKVLSAVQSYDVLNYTGGMPTSLVSNGQQWDFPNGWAPLQMFAIEGFLNLGETGAQWSAQVASNWLQNNYNGWLDSNMMFEKYNVSSQTGIPGNGGEYAVQAGFGWTNGVVLELLFRFCSTQSCINSEGYIEIPYESTASPPPPPTNEETPSDSNHVLLYVVLAFVGVIILVAIIVVVVYFFQISKKK